MLIWQLLGGVVVVMAASVALGWLAVQLVTIDQRAERRRLTEPAIKRYEADQLVRLQRRQQKEQQFLTGRDAA